MMDWIWTFVSGAVAEDWRSAVILSLYKGKEKRTGCKNYRCRGLLNVIETIYAGLLVGNVHKVIEVLIVVAGRGV